MAAHADILDQPERLSKPFWGSMVLHVSAVCVVLLLTTIEENARLRMGSPTGGGIGSVMVSPVATIPLPSRSGPENPVANPTESAVPEPPKAKTKAQPKVKAVEEKAIPLKSRNAEKRPAEAASRPNKWREQQKDLPNQTYSDVGQQVNTKMYGITGGGGVGVGDSSPFGTQFGWYATALRDQVARNWNTTGLDPRITTAPAVVVSFTIKRDGTVDARSVRVVQTSGNSVLDVSAQRAVLEAVPFPALPPQFPRDHADVELRFELRR